MSRPSARPAPRIVVIGAGFGGLSAALRLAAAGQDVTVVERTATVGGKARQVSVGGHGVAGGPTVFTMRWVFDALFAEAGSSTEAELALTRAHVLARHAWPDGSRFDLMADAEATVEGIRAFAGDAEATRYARFARETERAFRLFRHSFIEASRPSPLDIVRRLGPVGSAELLAVRPAASMWRVLCARLRDPRLRQLFGRYATYCGSSPFRAPATLTLIAHVEQLGVWTVAGGMQAVAGRLARLIERHGGRLRLGTGVARIEVAGGRAAAVILEDGTRIAADAVVFNGDAGALGAGLLGGDVRRASPATRVGRRSLSALVWCARTRAEGFPLSHHTVFFGPDYPREFSEIAAGRLPPDPTTYVCAEDRAAADGPPPEGPERLQVLVNAPATGDTDQAPSEEEIARCREETCSLMARAGLSLELSPREAVLTGPREFAALFPGTGGALYGRATHGPVASFLRPTARTRVPGLYLVGGSAHPGSGVPMAVLSGAQAAQALMADLASMPRFRPVAISGGISTRSPTTARMR